jgi:hypothetical protein
VKKEKKHINNSFRLAFVSIWSYFEAGEMGLNNAYYMVYFDYDKNGYNKYERDRKKGGDLII